MRRSTAVCAVIALLALACRSSSGVFRGLALGVTPEAPPAAEPLSGAPLSDLVVVEAGRYQIDHFDVCEPGDAASDPLARSAAAAAGDLELGGVIGGFQVLIHSEASVEEISRDRFVAVTTRAALHRIEELTDESGSGWREAPLICREIAEPEGDVDYEIDVRVSAAGAEVAVVDVARRNLVLPTAARHSGERCLRDPTGVTYCAASSDGTAVKTNLGQVVCARGQCVRPAIGDWRCSRAAAGLAELDDSGRAHCERGCYSPSSTQCRMMR